MRKITQNAINSFLNDNPIKIDNTQVILNANYGNPQTELYLFNNLIALKPFGSDKISISNAGWKSKTTKERLNGLPNVRINQKQGEWYLNGIKWGGEFITIQNQ
jgi:hypothetical protein